MNVNFHVLFAFLLLCFSIVHRAEPPQEQHRKVEEKPEAADKGEGIKGAARKAVKNAENDEGSGVSQSTEK